MYSPFLRMDDPHPSEILTDAAVHVLAERGLASFSVGALAWWMKVTPAAVLKATNRAQVIEVVCARFAGDGWHGWCRSGTIPARLPASDDERHGVRVWAALAELARGEALAGRDVPARIVADVRRREHRQIADEFHRRHEREPAAHELRTIGALVDGVRTALAMPEPALTLDQARAVLVERAWDATTDQDRAAATRATAG